MVGPKWDKETTKLAIGQIGLIYFLMFFLRYLGNKCIINGFMDGFMRWSLRSNLN